MANQRNGIIARREKLPFGATRGTSRYFRIPFSIPTRRFKGESGDSSFSVIIYLSGFSGYILYKSVKSKFNLSTFFVQYSSDQSLTYNHDDDDDDDKLLNTKLVVINK